MVDIVCTLFNSYVGFKAAKWIISICIYLQSFVQLISHACNISICLTINVLSHAMYTVHALEKFIVTALTLSRNRNVSINTTDSCTQYLKIMVSLQKLKLCSHERWVAEVRL